MDKDQSEQDDFLSDPDNLTEEISPDTAVILARIDERTKQTNEILERTIAERIEPLETQAEKNDRRSRRNEMILGGVTTASVIIFTWSLGFIPI